MTRIATNIETQKWYSIIKTLTNSGWKLQSEYELFDKGIDFDFYELRNKNETILLAWDNWFEGEIKCSENTMNYLEKLFEIKFEYGNSEHLRDDLLDKLKNLIKGK